MPRSAAPRKQYRPRAVARPVLEKMRRDLILPAYVHIRTLTHSTDSDAQMAAMSTFVLMQNTLSRALEIAGRDLEPIKAGQLACMSMIERYREHKVYRPTGPELEALRRSIEHCDNQLPYLDTRRLIEALMYVDRKMDELMVES
jgi:hypothetical protein